LRIIGLEDRKDHFPAQLSGGERQRIAIGRALALKPDILIADEPTGNLDPIHTWDIINLLVRINELGTTVILASHDKEIINSLGKRVISIEKGKIIRDEEEGRFIV
jgi:cell division transport system ATP-binding protein